jgi:hypothetical protein
MASSQKLYDAAHLACCNVEEQHFIYVFSISQGLRNQVNEQIQSNQSIISLIQERISNQTQIEEEKNTGKRATG